MRVGAPPLERTPPRRETTEVANAATTATKAEVKQALAKAFERHMGHAPSGRAIDVLYAQVAVETGDGAKMMNNNFGGIKGASPEGLTTSYGTHEVEGGKSVATRAQFRAYRTLDQGADDYVGLLSRKFSSALTRADLGDVSGFAHELKSHHYFTANEADYARALESRMSGVCHVPAAPGSTPPRDTPSCAEYASGEAITRAFDAISISLARISQEDDPGG